MIFTSLPFTVLFSDFAVVLLATLAINWEYSFRRYSHKKRNLSKWARLPIHMYFRFIFALH